MSRTYRTNTNDLHSTRKVRDCSQGMMYGPKPVRPRLSARDDIAAGLEDIALNAYEAEQQAIATYEAQQEQEWLELEARIAEEDERMTAIVAQEDAEWRADNEPCPYWEHEGDPKAWAQAFYTKHKAEVDCYWTAQQDAEDQKDSYVGKAFLRAEQSDRMDCRTILNIVPEPCDPPWL